MEKLPFQDSAFLKLESPERPFHVAGLLIMQPPAQAGPHYYRDLRTKLGRLNEVWPAFDKKLADPLNEKEFALVKAEDYSATNHVFHYSLASPGRQADLMQIISNAHESLLNRAYPLWQIHLVEGLPGGRFALYCKVHHALVDGVGALGMVTTLFDEDPNHRVSLRSARPRADKHLAKQGLLEQISAASAELIKHSRALPELSGFLGHLGKDALLGKKNRPVLPFTSPRTPFNDNIDGSREIIVCNLPLSQLRRIAKTAGGTINDVLLAICGGALRDYLEPLGQLPRQSLTAGIPVAVKTPGERQGNQLSFVFCPFATDTRSVQQRLKRIIETTRSAKRDLAKMSATGRKDLINILMIPTLLLTLTGNASRVNPALNAVVSNVPGSRNPLYLDGARLESIYPLSVVSDSMGLNFTIVSYATKACIAITACASHGPDLQKLGPLMKANFQSLRDSIQ